MNIDFFSVLIPLLPGKPLYSRRLWVALILFALLFGIFLARMTASYQRTENPPQWGQAMWIAPPTPGAVAYYRGEFSLDSQPTRASIQVAAPDRYTLYVNGQQVEDIKRPSTAIFDVMDIGNYLSSGRNVIAIRVERSTVPGLPSLRAHLRWQNQSGVMRDVPQQGIWRVALREERQSGGTLAWYESSFDDSGWKSAVPLDHQDAGIIYPAHPWASPELLQVFPRGMWIGNGHPETASVRLMREFYLGHAFTGGNIRSAWLGVASTVPYMLIINGAHGPTIPATGQFMDTYDIGSFLFAGKNTIEIEASSFSGDGRLAVAALVKTSHGLLDLSSDENWRVQNGSAWQAVTLMGELKAYPYLEKSGLIFTVPTLRLVEIPLPGGLLLRHLMAALPWMIGVLLIALLVLTLILSRLSQLTRTMVAASALPWIVADLLLCVAFLLPFDVRLTEAQVFNGLIAFILVVCIGSLLALFMADAKNGLLKALDQ
ncbi:MAG: hypothetical protein Q7S51_02135 [Gallionellaceae bacterium]|nr:hypothetical protein [Gallionellaceae bacterium]